MHSKKEGKNCMKTIGITRRIDDLGRIVIPKEIRKNMHIKSGELLEIYLSDSETIALKKHSVLSKNENFIGTFIETLAKKTNSNIFVTSTEEIIFSNVKDVVGQKISSELLSNESKKAVLKISNTYELQFKSKIYQIIPNGDFVGYLIIESKEDLDNHFELISFALLFLESYLETE